MANLGQPVQRPDTSQNTYEITNIKPEVATPVVLLRDHRKRNVKVYPKPSTRGFWTHGDTIKLPLSIEGAHYVDLDGATLIARYRCVQKDTPANHGQVAIYPHMFFNNQKLFDHPDMVRESRDHHFVMNSNIIGSIMKEDRVLTSEVIDGYTGNAAYSEYNVITNPLSLTKVLCPFQSNSENGDLISEIPFSTIFDGHAEAIPIHLLDNDPEWHLTIAPFHELGMCDNQAGEQMELRITDLYLICKGIWGMAGSTVTEEDFKFHTMIPLTVKDRADVSKTKYSTEVKKSSIVKAQSYLVALTPEIAIRDCNPYTTLDSTCWVSPTTDLRWDLQDTEYNFRLGSINYPAQSPVQGLNETYYWLKKFYRKQDVVGTWGAADGICIPFLQWDATDNTSSDADEDKIPMLALSAEFDVLSTKKLINGVPMERNSPILELKEESDSILTRQIGGGGVIEYAVYRVIHYWYDVIVTFTAGKMLIDD